MPWVLFALVLGAIVALAAVAIFARQGGSLTTTMTADQHIIYGVVFVAAGTAITATMGPYMVWMIAVGLGWMLVGVWKKRSQAE